MYVYIHESVCMFVEYNLHPVCVSLFQQRLNPPTPSNGNTGNARETKLHTLSRWDVIIEDLSSEEDDVPLQE